jgi:hypothetical protein
MDATIVERVYGVQQTFPCLYLYGKTKFKIFSIGG